MLTSIHINYESRDFFGNARFDQADLEAAYETDESISKAVAKALTFVGKTAGACAFFHFEDGSYLRVYGASGALGGGNVELTRYYRANSCDAPETMSVGDARKIVRSAVKAGGFALVA